MEHEFQESSYSKLRKRSDHRLRQAEPERHEKSSQPLAGYEASEQERREKKTPKEALYLRGGKQRFSAGYDEDGRLVMAFSADKNDGVKKEQETVKKEGASTMKEDKKYFRTGTHDPERGAVFLESREEKRKSCYMERSAKVIQAPGENLIETHFPFLSGKEEKEHIRYLEELARSLGPEEEEKASCRKQAEGLRQDLTAKEQERRDFLKKLASQVTPEKTERKKGDVRRYLQQMMETEENQENPEEPDDIEKSNNSDNSKRPENTEIVK